MVPCTINGKRRAELAWFGAVSLERRFGRLRKKMNKRRIKT
jgi:hypothetical protein